MAPRKNKAEARRDEGLAWEWAAERIRAHIRRLPVGAEVPSSAHWRETLGISRTTIIRAFNELKNRGELQAVVGSRTVKGPGARTRTVLVLIGETSTASDNPGGPFLMGASRSADRLGDVMAVHVDPENLGDDWNPVATFPGLAGVLFFRGPGHAARFGPRLDAAGVPWILYGSSAYATELAVDENALSRLALDAFGDLGHRRIGILHVKNHPPSEARLTAWKEWHASRGWPAPEERAWGMESWAELEEGRLRAWLSEVTAVFCTGDGEAVSLMEHARPLGVRVPEDLSILGVNNQALGGRLRPPLGSVAIQLDVHGEEALRLLLEKTPGVRARGTRLLADMRLVPRGTLAPPRKGELFG